jgi:hypothetical protein
VNDFHNKNFKALVKAIEEDTHRQMQRYFISWIGGIDIVKFPYYSK